VSPFPLDENALRTFKTAGALTWGMDLRPRLAAPIISLLALIPVVLYANAKEQYWLVLSAACVLLIAGSLYYMFSPAEEHVGDDAALR
jgi:hypothetical protein